MGLQITVFVDKPPTKKQEDIVKVLNQKFTVLVDAVHGKDKDYLKHNYVKNYRFFFLSEFLSMCTADELDYVAPDFVVCFNHDEDITEKDWVCIERYIEIMFVPSVRHSEIVTKRAAELLQSYTKPDPIIKPEDQEPLDLKSHYELYMKHVEERDTMLIQVEKPFCDLPYTVVIRNYSEKGLKSFFTDLFICYSWGVSRKDYEFLEQVWKHWNMEGEYDLDKMLREATERCFPRENAQPDQEPEVYRKPIEQVLEKFQEREQGKHPVPYSDDWNQQRLKKRKLDDALLED